VSLDDLVLAASFGLGTGLLREPDQLFRIAGVVGVRGCTDGNSDRELPRGCALFDGLAETFGYCPSGVCVCTVKNEKKLVTDKPAGQKVVLALTLFEERHQVTYHLVTSVVAKLAVVVAKTVTVDQEDRAGRRLRGPVKELGQVQLGRPLVWQARQRVGECQLADVRDDVQRLDDAFGEQGEKVLPACGPLVANCNYLGPVTPVLFGP